jgi:hypothetical protein
VCYAAVSEGYEGDVNLDESYAYSVFPTGGTLKGLIVKDKKKYTAIKVQTDITVQQDFNDGKWFAFPYTAAVSIVIGSVLLRAWRTTSLTGDFIVSFNADNAGSPGVEITSGSIAANSLPTADNVDTTITFDDEIQVVSGTTYWVVFRIPSELVEIASVWGTAVAVDGAVESLDSGGTWNPIMVTSAVEQVRESYTTGDNTSSIVGTALNYQRMQSITPLVSHTAWWAKVRIYRVGTPDTLTVYVYATDGAGKPTGDPLAYGDMDASGITTNSAGAWYTMLLYDWVTSNPGVALVAGVKYAIVLSENLESNSDYILWRVDSVGATYAGGQGGYSTDYGASWTLNAADYDFMFSEGDYVVSPYNFRFYLFGRGPGVGSSYTFTVRVNGVDTGLSCVVSDYEDSAEDLVNTVVVAQGDLVTISVTPAGSPVPSYYCLALQFDSTVDFESCLFSGDLDPYAMYGWEQEFHPICGSCDGEGYEPWMEQPMAPQAGSKFILKNLSAYVTVPPGVGKSRSFYLRSGEADAGPVVTISDAGQYGCDAVNVYLVDVEKFLDIRKVNANFPDATGLKFSMLVTVPITRNLTVTAGTGGTVTVPGIGVFSYDEGTVVDLLAVVNVAHYYPGLSIPNLGIWTGDIGTLADPDCAATQIVMSADYSIMANFVEKYLLQAKVSDSYTGNILSPPCGEDFRTYEEYDPAVELSRTQDRITFSTSVGSEVYAVFDKGVDYINLSGDFEFLADVRITGGDGLLTPFLLAKLKSTWGGLVVDDFVGVQISVLAGTVTFNVELYNEVCDGPILVGGTAALSTAPLTMYLRFWYDSFRYEHGMFYCDNYASAADRATESNRLARATLTDAPFWSHGPLRYLYGLNLSGAVSGYVENLVWVGHSEAFQNLSAVVPIEASANTSLWKEWLGDVSQVADPTLISTVITMLDDYDIEAFLKVYVDFLTPSQGHVVIPGEGVFVYDAGSVVSAEAEAVANFEFDYWTLSFANLIPQKESTSYPSGVFETDQFLSSKITNPTDITVKTNLTLSAVYRVIGAPMPPELFTRIRIDDGVDGGSWFYLPSSSLMVQIKRYPVQLAFPNHNVALLDLGMAADNLIVRGVTNELDRSISADWSQFITKDQLAEVVRAWGGSVDVLAKTGFPRVRVPIAYYLVLGNGDVVISPSPSYPGGNLWAMWCDFWHGQFGNCRMTHNAGNRGAFNFDFSFKVCKKTQGFVIINPVVAPVFILNVESCSGVFAVDDLVVTYSLYTHDYPAVLPYQLVRLEALETGDYTFDHWTGDVPADANALDSSFYVTMDKSRDLEAFSKVAWVNADGGPYTPAAVQANVDNIAYNGSRKLCRTPQGRLWFVFAGSDGRIYAAYNDDKGLSAFPSWLPSPTGWIVEQASYTEDGGGLSQPCCACDSYGGLYVAWNNDETYVEYRYRSELGVWNSWHGLPTSISLPVGQYAWWIEQAGVWDVSISVNSLSQMVMVASAPRVLPVPPIYQQLWVLYGGSGGWIDAYRWGGVGDATKGSVVVGLSNSIHIAYDSQRYHPPDPYTQDIYCGDDNVSMKGVYVDKQTNPCVAVDPSGYPAVVWQGKGWGLLPLKSRVMYRRKGPSGWEPIINLYEDTFWGVDWPYAGDHYSPSIAVDKNGVTHIAWEWDDGTTKRVLLQSCTQKVDEIWEWSTDMATGTPSAYYSLHDNKAVGQTLQPGWLSVTCIDIYAASTGTGTAVFEMWDVSSGGIPTGSSPIFSYVIPDLAFAVSGPQWIGVWFPVTPSPLLDGDTVYAFTIRGTGVGAGNAIRVYYAVDSTNPGHLVYWDGDPMLPWTADDTKDTLFKVGSGNAITGWSEIERYWVGGNIDSDDTFTPSLMHQYWPLKCAFSQNTLPDRAFVFKGTDWVSGLPSIGFNAWESEADMVVTLSPSDITAHQVEVWGAPTNYTKISLGHNLFDSAGFAYSSGEFSWPVQRPREHRLDPSAAGFHSIVNAWGAICQEGEPFSATLHGLAPGTLYNCVAFAKDASFGTGTYWGNPRHFLTAPGPPTGFAVTEVVPGKVKMDWKNTILTEFTPWTMIRYKTTGYPTSPTDGILAYFGPLETVTLYLNTTIHYYFRAWSYISWEYLSGYSVDYVSGVYYNAIPLPHITF